MIVVYKNFFRNRMVNLSKKSVQHFLPDAKFYAVSLFKHSTDEYASQEPLDADIVNCYRQTKWVLNNNRPLDTTVDSESAGYAYLGNARLFCEGLNFVYEEFKHTNEKVLMLAEDHFFTTGETLRELTNNEFDWSYGTWTNSTDVNGSILCFRPQALSYLLPIEEGMGTVEPYLEEKITLQVDPSKRHRLTTRHHLDYHGDGFYTNSSDAMTTALKDAGII